MSGFLSRWSQRKLAEKEGEPPPPEPPSEAPAEAAPALAAEQPPEAPRAEEELDLSTLPPVETLTAESDFSVFWKKGVPEGLRQAALRRAWVADPLIRDHVSPLDYGWDFNSPGGLPPGFTDALSETAEKLAELLRQAVGEPEPEPVPAPDVTVAESLPAPAEETNLPAQEMVLLAEDAAPPPQEPVLAPEEFPAPKRRHGGALPA